LTDLVHAHKAGEDRGITSICSAHPLVLEAAARQALADGTDLLVEATSNQVDQYGGYTGMRPADFRDLVLGIADRVGLDRGRVLLGGDHLGPNRWQDLDPAEAMDRAEVLVAEYVAAGFTKIHLDCSMALRGDTLPLSDEVVAGRAARLLAVAEDARPGRTAAAAGAAASDVVYVIGTEVPVPGGAHETLDHVAATPADAARATLDAHRDAIAAVGLSDVWPRIVALVVQPGVEFDHVKVVDYDRTVTAALRAVPDAEPDLLFEAHSTDYQTVSNLRALVEDGWFVLKVGPGLTFALREAMVALSAIEEHLVPEADRADLPGVMERRMLAEPGYWEHYYEGDADEQRIARAFSYSDRMRYYWPAPDVEAACERLFANLDRTGIPEPLISQYLPAQYWRVRSGALLPTASELAVDRVRDVLRDYAAACTPGTVSTPVITPSITPSERNALV
jgi:D-tagatose-1,6-bisphosphate aldolase subunit GatZ/KbaZ